MKAKNPTPIVDPVPADVPPTVAVGPRWRAAIHGWIIIHLTAMISAPLVFATMGAPLPEMLFRLSRPYMDLCYLDHGYAFFAPEVGPNHLVEYRVHHADESEPQVERFPNLRQQWPRLLYHRHFMLSESLNSRYAPPEMPEDFFPNREAYLRWQSQRALFIQLRDSYANHLQQSHKAERVELVRIEHRQPDVPEFESGTTLEDLQLYREMPDMFTPLAPPPPPEQPGNRPADGPSDIGPRRFPYRPENAPSVEVAP